MSTYGRPARTHASRRTPIRALVGLLILVLLAIPVATDPIAARTTVPVRPSGPDCIDGLTDITPLPPSTVLQSMVRLPDGRTFGVGLKRVEEGAFSALRMLTAVHDPASGWTFTESLAPNGRRATLAAVALGPSGTAWAAGTRLNSIRYQWPMVLRWDGAAWSEEAIPSTHGAAVAIAAERRSVWVSTVEVRGTGRFAALYRRKAGRWARVALPPIAGAERFSGIAAPTRDATFVVGSTTSATGIKPVILVRTGATWTREKVDLGGAAGVLTRVAIRPDGSAFASGWVVEPSRLRPLVVRRGVDRVWRRVTIAGATGVTSLLLGITAAPGRTVATGASYVSSAGDHLPALAVGDTQLAWSVLPWTGWFVQAVMGDPTADGWVVISRTRKSGGSSGLVARVCELTPVTDPGLRSTLAADRRRELTRARAAARRIAASELGDRKPRAGARALRRLAGPAGAILGDLELRDIAAPLGLPATTGSYGITSGDVNGDGRADLVWSRHGDPLAIYLRTDGGFEPYLGGGFAPADRHTCVAAPLDGDARADIACVTGGMAGLGLTSNELYLDPVGGSTRDTGTEAGVTDPVARGRQLVALDADGDGDLDLYQAGDERLDAIPQLHRLLRNDGAAGFTWDRTSGLGATFETTTAVAGDVDLDGDADLLVTSGRRATGGVGVHLYENIDGRFVEVPGGAGLAGPVPAPTEDSLIAQLDGTGRPEVVLLSSTLLRVLSWADGAYVPTLQRSLVNAFAVAAGDADGDGDLDLYVALGGNHLGQDDLLLRNDGTGFGWTDVSVPGTFEGPPDDVLAADLDGDGRDEFAVVAGRDAEGPFYLVDAIPAPDPEPSPEPSVAPSPDPSSAPPP